MAKLFLCLNLLCGLTTVIACASECTSYVIRPSQSQSCPGDRYSSATACVDNELTFSQFVNNSSDYLTNDTTLIFSPGNYSLESELVVENVHLFSMFAWSASSLKAVITCGHNARFAFRNISIVTVSGLEFVGCFENYVLSVGHFQLENSGFFGDGQPLVNGTVLSIEESTASLNRVAYVSVIDKPLTVQQEKPASKIPTPIRVHQHLELAGGSTSPSMPTQDAVSSQILGSSNSSSSTAPSDSSILTCDNEMKLTWLPALMLVSN